MKNKTQVENKLTEIKSDYDRFSSSNAKAGDHELNAKTEGEIDMLEWVLGISS